jgi:hypothetical protein
LSLLSVHGNFDASGEVQKIHLPCLTSLKIGSNFNLTWFSSLNHLKNLSIYPKEIADIEANIADLTKLEYLYVNVDNNKLK